MLIIYLIIKCSYFFIDFNLNHIISLTFTTQELDIIVLFPFIFVQQRKAKLSEGKNLPKIKVKGRDGI
jgi:hypothetical protein